jgi:transcription elongation GreA/GreB family factor
MSETKEVERLRSKKAELEAESRTLKETQKNMERQLKFLEEKIAIEELDNKNKATRNYIVQLESKIEILKNKLKQASQECIFTRNIISPA